MLSKKQKDHYRRLLDKKLASIGVEDKIMMRVVKLVKVPNPAYKPGAEHESLQDPKTNPQFYHIPRYAAANLRRNITKRLIRTGNKATIEAFLKSDLDALKTHVDGIKEEVSANGKE